MVESKSTKLLVKASTAHNTPTHASPLVLVYWVVGLLGTCQARGFAALRRAAPPTLPSPRLGSGNVVSGNR